MHRGFYVETHNNSAVDGEIPEICCFMRCYSGKKHAAVESRGCKDVNFMVK